MSMENAGTNRTFGKQVTSLNTDQEVMDEIENIWPQKNVRFLVERLIHDTVYDYHFAEKITVLREKFEDVGFDIENDIKDQDIRNTLLEFQESFYALDDFLVLNFGLDRGRKILSVHPKRKERSDYKEFKTDLKNLALRFKETHEKVLRKSREKLTSENQQQSEKKIRRTIEKDKDGDYRIADKKIVMAHNTIYYHVFDIAISMSDQETGLISFDQIATELKSRILAREIDAVQLQDASLDKEKSKKRIQNAISINQLFKFAKVKNRPLRNRLSNGTEIFESCRGKGYKINNPPL